MRTRRNPSSSQSVPRETGSSSRFYIPVVYKFWIAVTLSILWATLSWMLGRKWVVEMTDLFGAFLAYFLFLGIAVVPGFMNAFLVASLLLDRRPGFRRATKAWPGVSILVAAYNEESNIVQTILSIANQHYRGPLQVIAINDGSSDDTAAAMRSVRFPWLEVLDLKKNVGKANALTYALKRVQHSITITIDGDSFLHKRALQNLVLRYMSDPPNTRAVAGAVLVRNSRTNLVTKVQEWDYFHGIAAVKRLQSLYQGTLVAQGAFSAYDTQTLRDVGGWPHTVGEDIVLTWAILKAGHRVGFAENAVLFTNAPTTWKQFIRQRQRWSRGLMEAFKLHWQMLFKLRLTTLFIWWNLLFPYLDIVFSLAFVPGVILALFGIFWIAGPMTLAVLPLAFLVNWLMYSIQKKMFTSQGLKVRRNWLGLVIYVLFYGLILQPACVVGYIQEFVTRGKRWGTK